MLMADCVASAALMTGSMVDGSARMLERAIRNVGHGYSAVYYVSGHAHAVRETLTTCFVERKRRL